MSKSKPDPSLVSSTTSDRKPRRLARQESPPVRKAHDAAKARRRAWLWTRGYLP